MADAEKNYRSYDYVSRYESFPYYYDKKSNRYYYGLTSFLDDTVSYTLYEVKNGDNYDSIALNNYGCALYWWIICDFNRIFDTLEEPTPGTKLKLPSLNAIAYLES